MTEVFLFAKHMMVIIPLQDILNLLGQDIAMYISLKRT